MKKVDEQLQYYFHIINTFFVKKKKKKKEIQIHFNKVLFSLYPFELKLV